VVRLGVVYVVPDSDMSVASGGLVGHGHLVGLVGRGSGRSRGKDDYTVCVLDLWGQDVVEDIL
jgi:hypothetical protein